MELTGAFLRNRRKELHLTLQDVADATGVTRATVQKWETGAVKNIGSQKIMALARILDLKAEDVLAPNEEAFYPVRPQMTQQQEILFDATDGLSEEDMNRVIQMVHLMKSMKG